MEKKYNYRLGLDIGIASVGWGIVDENDDIIDAGVRLFPEGGSVATVAERRVKRGARRLLRRRMHRNERARKLFVDYGLISSVDEDMYINKITPYELRVRGLKEELTPRELSIALLHLVKRRGIHNFEIKLSDSNKKEEEAGTKKTLLENDKELINKYVCELQMDRIKKSVVDEHNGNVRGKNNIFRTEEYVKEAKAILENQKKYNLKLDEEFSEKYISILEGRREYFQGPGKVIKIKGIEKNVSPYGWLNEEDWIEKLFGRCTYFPEEIRMVKNSYTAELFNLLNDLNNLSIKREGNEKLIKEEKEQIIKLAKEQKSGLSLSKIAKLLNVSATDISGYKIDKSEKAKFTPLKTYIEVSKIIGNEDRNTIDEIGRILTIFQSKDKIKENIKNNLKILDEKILEELSELSGYTGSHSLSKKAMELILEELIETSKNQMELFTEKGLTPLKMDFQNSRNLPKEYISQWVSSSVVKRALTQTINVINAIHKKYGVPSEVVIEMAREENSKEKIDFIKKIQKNNEKINKEIREMILGKKIGKGTFEKLKYFKLQGEVCVYSGEMIIREELINFPENYEIDHIIPRSISFDDSESNKVLVKRIENQKKGKNSPYGYLSVEGRYEEYKARILNMYKNKLVNKKKLEYLLFEGDLDKYATKFIARNLVDTRITTREFMTLLRKFYKDKEFDVKIKSIRGSVTNQIRKEWKFKKEREISHKHHAQDALIILYGEKILNSLPYVKAYNIQSEDIKVDIRTGEILGEKEYKELFGYKYGNMIREYDRWRYSHYVDKKPNRQLTGETIYSTRVVTKKVMKGEKEVEEISEYYISKLSGIYDKTNKDIKNFFEDEKKKKQLLMYHHDYKTFEKFMKVYEAYSKEVNPFFAYYNEHKKYITKYAKKDNGPPVFDIKYRVKQLGSHLDLSHKYNLKDTGEKNRKKVVMLTIPSLRADFYKKGETYKFVSVTYLMMQDKGKYYELNLEEYEVQKNKKEIDESYEFIFSLYSGDIFEYGIRGAKEKFRFKGVSDSNVIEVDLIDRNYKNYISKLKELQEQLKVNPNLDVAERYNLISGLIISPIESKKIVKEASVRPQKSITIKKEIDYMKKIYTNNLGVEYDSKEKFLTRIPK